MQINKRDSRILGFVSLALLLMYIYPLWHIDLEAPQYPEGIGLRIMISTVKGLHEHDLNNINNLNHYIGMKRIEPDAIPELKIMPVLIGVLIVFGLVAAFTRKRWMLITWTTSFLVMSIVGLVDFWLWEYDYGHNLDLEMAIIKVPGLFYQPPLIGSKQLLNFTAHSWPGVGGWIAIVSVMVGCILVIKNVFMGRNKNDAESKSPSSAVPGQMAGAALFLMFILSACANDPEPIYYGEDQGAHCRMTIADNRFATQIVSVTGRSIKFDSIECLMSYVQSGTIKKSDIASVWVIDGESPGMLIPAENAHFVKSSTIRSPMGGGLIAYSSVAAASVLAAEVNGIHLTWKELQDDFSIQLVSLK